MPHASMIEIKGKQYRQLTADEARAAHYRQEIQFVRATSTGYEIKRVFVSGACKTWKTRPHDFRLPVKFGLYESTAIVNSPSDPTLAWFEQAPNGTIPVVEVN